MWPSKKLVGYPCIGIKYDVTYDNEQLLTCHDICRNYHIKKPILHVHHDNLTLFEGANMQLDS